MPEGKSLSKKFKKQNKNKWHNVGVALGLREESPKKEFLKCCAEKNLASRAFER